MRNKLVIIVLIVMVGAFMYLRIKQAVAPAPQQSPALSLPVTDRKNSEVIRVGKTMVTVEIANTPEARVQGLSGRDPLPELHGMLFPMGEPLRHIFWMKDMKFALDIIWIRAGKIVDISENVPPPSGDAAPAIVSPQEPADAVLEVNADFTEKYGVKVGDRVSSDI